jgi:predicted Zn-dependent peptidase
MKRVARDIMRGLMIAAAYLATASAGPPAAAERESPPPIGVPRPFTLPSRTEFRLDNGLRVTLVPFGTVPKATLYCIVETGRVADHDRPGLADLTVALMKEGAGKRDTAAVAALAADMGGSLEIGAGVNEISVGLDVLSERTSEAISLIADTLQRPRLPAAELPRLKSDFARAIAVEHAQAQGIAGEAFARQLWGDSPFGHGNPSDAELTQITIDDIRAFARREFGAGRTHLYIAGRFDALAVRQAITHHFGAWRRGAIAQSVSPHSNARHSVTLIDRPGAAQSTILMGLPTIDLKHPQYTALSVANGLLGGSLLSRLEQNLREDKGYTYGIGTQLSPYLGISSWTLATDVNTVDTAAAITEIYREINRLRTEPPDPAELDRTKRYRTGHFLLGSSSRAGLLTQLSFIDQQELPLDWLTRYAERTEAVTPVQVTDITASAIDPTQMTLVIVGDLSRIRTSLLSLPELQDATLIDKSTEPSHE